MFRLIRWAFWFVTFCVLLYFAATVPLGSRTLIEHVRAIWSTQEAQDLAKGTRDKAGEVADRVKQQLEEDAHKSGDAPAPPPAPTPPPVHAGDRGAGHARGATR